MTKLNPYERLICLGRQSYGSPMCRVRVVDVSLLFSLQVSSRTEVSPQYPPQTIMVDVGCLLGVLEVTDPSLSSPRLFHLTDPSLLLFFPTSFALPNPPLRPPPCGPCGPPAPPALRLRSRRIWLRGARRTLETWRRRSRTSWEVRTCIERELLQ